MFNRVNKAVILLGKCETFNAHMSAETLELNTEVRRKGESERTLLAQYSFVQLATGNGRCCWLAAHWHVPPPASGMYFRCHMAVKDLTPTGRELWETSMLVKVAGKLRWLVKIATSRWIRTESLNLRELVQSQHREFLEGLIHVVYLHVTADFG